MSSRRTRTSLDPGIERPDASLRPADVIAAEHECMRLIALYAHYIDFGQAALVSGLFTPDGIWESPKKTLSGHAELHAAFALRQQVRRRSRHICTNSVVNVLSRTDASGLTYFTLYRRDDASDGERLPASAPWAIGEYRDQFRCIDGGWRFAHRVVSFGFGGPHR